MLEEDCGCVGGTCKISENPQVKRLTDEEMLAIMEKGRDVNKEVLVEKLAEALARRFHLGQVDKAGAPYILHIERVVARLKTPVERTIGWLHDLLEDTDITEQMLVSLFGRSIADGVRALTRRNKEPYEGYIQFLVRYGTKTELMVKWADLLDHLENPNPIPSLRSRYENALGEIEQVLYDKWGVE